MASAQQLAEATRLREAAQAALGEAEARWRSQLGAATQERQRLRAEISTLTKRLLGGGHRSFVTMWELYSSSFARPPPKPARPPVA